jgi:hypothetical protein
MAISDNWRCEYEETASQLESEGRIAKASDQPVQEMLATLGADLNATDERGWSALMWACAKGNASAVKALLAAGADPRTGSVAVVHISRCGGTNLEMFFHEGMDACAIATKAGNRSDDARRVAHFMFHTLHVDQRLLAAYRRLLLAAGLEEHLWQNQEGSPLAWLEIELVTVAACVPPVTKQPVCDRWHTQGFAWHGDEPEHGVLVEERPVIDSDSEYLRGFGVGPGEALEHGTPPRSLRQSASVSFTPRGASRQESTRPPRGACCTASGPSPSRVRATADKASARSYDDKHCMLQ